MSVQRGPLVAELLSDQTKETKMRRSEVRKFDNSKLPKRVLSRPQKQKRLLDAVVEPAPKLSRKKAPAKAKKSATKKKG